MRFGDSRYSRYFRKKPAIIIYHIVDKVFKEIQRLLGTLYGILRPDNCA